MKPPSFIKIKSTEIKNNCITVNVELVRNIAFYWYVFKLFCEILVREVKKELRYGKSKNR